MFISPVFLMQTFLLLFSVVIHEAAHGWVADRCGDDTARLAGRITLNPIPHIDLFGSILLPFLLQLTGSRIFIAWAKPVPVNPARLRNPRTDAIKVSFAGVGANLTTAVCFALLLWLLPDRRNFFRQDMIFRPDDVFILSPIAGAFNIGIQINLVLAIFNLLPIPPLDGSWIVSELLPYRASQWFRSISPYGIFIILFLLYFGLVGRIVYPIVFFLHKMLLS